MLSYDYDLIFGTVLVLFIVALFVERFLALLFGLRLYRRFLNGLHVKPVVAFIVCYFVVSQYDFDALSLVMNRGSHFWGPVITAGVIAGGSKGVITIWRKIKEMWGMK